MSLDPKSIDRSKIDQSNMFEYIYKFPEQMNEAKEIGENISPEKVYKKVDSIVFCGMGGSGIGGDVVSTFLNQMSEINSTVIRGYHLPNWVNENTLVILLSYSGNTEETLSCLQHALEKNAKVIGFSSGGILQKKLKEIGSDHFLILSGYLPRTALGFLSIPVLFFLHKIGLIKHDFSNELSQTIDSLGKWREIFCSEQNENPAFEIAGKIYNTIPVIYGVSGTTETAAIRLRCQLEENGKMTAFHHSLPEMNHNEIVGYENNKELLKQLSVIWLHDSNDHDQIKKRQVTTSKIISKYTGNQMIIESEGDSFFERLFYLLYFGDWVSYWTAICHKTDPTPVKKIDKIKAGLIVEQWRRGMSGFI